MSPSKLPPIPLDTWEVQRHSHTRLRRRIMAGVWSQDLEDWLFAHLGPVRSDVVGPRDLSRNVLRNITRQLSKRYDAIPFVHHADGDLEGFLGTWDEVRLPSGDTGIARRPGLLDNAGLWQLAQRNEAQTLALNESLLYPSYSADHGLLFQIVPPDMVVAEGHPDAPDMPLRLSWARPRQKPGTDEMVWCWDTWDVSDAAAPTYTIRIAADGKGHLEGEEITGAVLGEAAGEYRWRYQDGSAFIPHVMYHRERHGSLWDPWEGREAVDGTLTVGVLWSFWMHGVRDAGWPQRYFLDSEPIAAGVSRGTSHRMTMETDPSSAVGFRTSRGSKFQGQIGQWEPGCEPESLQRALTAYEQSLAEYAGVDPGDLIRTTGDPRSGYALAVSKSGVEKAQARFEPQFQRSDQELLGKSAAIVNRATSSAWPESGYYTFYNAGSPIRSADEPEVAPVEEVAAAK